MTLFLLALFVIIPCFLIYLLAGPLFNGLPVLMYHKVSDKEPPDFLTITTEKLENQFLHLIKKGYTTIFLSDLLSHELHGKPLPKKPVMLTFDDGYKNNYSKLYPLLLKHNLKANIFLVAGYIRTSNKCISTADDEYLHVQEINGMSSDTVQFGLHTYDHSSYSDISTNEINRDISMSVDLLKNLQIPFQPCLAYAYGAYPRKDPKKRADMFNVLKANDVRLAMRIGNRLNRLPLKDPYLIERIDIRGDDSYLKFRLSLIAGKKIIFW